LGHDLGGGPHRKSTLDQERSRPKRTATGLIFIRTLEPQNGKEKFCGISTASYTQKLEGEIPTTGKTALLSTGRRWCALQPVTREVGGSQRGEKKFTEPVSRSLLLQSRESDSGACGGGPQSFHITEVGRRIARTSWWEKGKDSIGKPLPAENIVRYT